MQFLSRFFLYTLANISKSQVNQEMENCRSTRLVSLTTLSFLQRCQSARSVINYAFFPGSENIVGRIPDDSRCATNLFLYMCRGPRAVLIIFHEDKATKSVETHKYIRPIFLKSKKLKFRVAWKTFEQIHFGIKFSQYLWRKICKIYWDLSWKKKNKLRAVQGFWKSILEKGLFKFNCENSGIKIRVF